MGDAERAVPPIPSPIAIVAPADFVDRVWTLLSSLRLALGLILATAALGLASVLIVQAPPGLPPASPAFAAWVERVARPRYGPATDALATLQIFTATGSVWMRLLLGLLAANTLVCTLSRLPGIWRSIGRPVGEGDDERSFAGAYDTVVVADDREAESIAERITLALRAARYRVGTETGPVTYVSADRNRFARLGTLATHVAIVMLLVGAYATAAWGLRVPDFAVAEGSARPVGLGTALRLRLDGFSAAYHPDGTPRDYRSDVVLLDGSEEIARQTVRVNEPLTWAGLGFHQESFGPAAILRIADGSGDTTFADGVALDQRIGSRPAGIVGPDDLGIAGVSAGEVGEDGLGVEVVVLGAAPGDPALQPDQIRIEVLSNGEQLGGEVLRVGETARVAGLTVSYLRESAYSSFQIVRDPGAPIVWIASALLVVGIAITFGFPFQSARIRLRRVDDGRTAIDVAVCGRIGPASDVVALIEAPVRS